MKDNLQIPYGVADFKAIRNESLYYIDKTDTMIGAGFTTDLAQYNAQFIYYKMDGIDSDYNVTTDNERSINYTNLRGGNYRFNAYAVDEYGQTSNRISIELIKEKRVYEHVWFWVVAVILALSFVAGIAFLIIHIKYFNQINCSIYFN